MAKKLNIAVQSDYIESLTNVSGYTGLNELIWNALDADATRIDITTISNGVDITSIEIQDNGLGIPFSDAESAFGKLGGSDKAVTRKSPSGRFYHGKQGKGRYNAFALGNLVSFDSYYNEGDKFYHFNVELDRNDINTPEMGDLISQKGKGNTGVKVTINNLNNAKVHQTFRERLKTDLQQKFAVYYYKYPNFTITINGDVLDFKEGIVDQRIIPIEPIKDGKNSYPTEIRIIEWAVSAEKKIHLMNSEGQSFGERNLGVSTNKYNLSVFLESDYIEHLANDGQLEFDETNIYLKACYAAVRNQVKGYIREKLHKKSLDFIQELKKKQLYPYKEEPKDNVENVTRQVYDIVALQINEYLPKFSEQSDPSKKLTLSLLKEALESDSSSLRRILEEVVNLPQEKVDDLNDLLETSNLSEIIDMTKEITNRVRLVYELRELVLSNDYNAKVKERKHLHKIIERNTWLFGDEYALGASDITLKNVLKSHLQQLGRDDFESLVDDDDNDELNTIPDVCLWKQYNNGKPGYFRNLVIELKRPIVDAGTDELQQIKNYANKVSKDIRFDKDKTEWTFILLTRNIKNEIEIDCEQEHRKYGHVIAKPNLNVWVLPWTTVFNEADARHQYLKEKLNFSITEDRDGLELLKSTYSEFLPDSLVSAPTKANGTA